MQQSHLRPAKQLNHQQRRPRAIAVAGALVIPRKGNDVNDRTCRECNQPLPVRSRSDRIYCSKRCANRKHVIKWRKTKRDRRAEYFDRTCVTCSTEFRSSRPTGKFCSDKCKGMAYATKCRLGPDHPVMVLIAEAREVRKAPAKPPAVLRNVTCAWCGSAFETTKDTQVYCQFDCKRRSTRNRRRGRQYGSTSHFTWAEFMRVFLKLDRCCAYCERVIDGQPDPDHVVPLSRGGSNSITNILPSCRACNSDKRDLLLDEWNADRARRGLDPRVTTWTTGDPRVVHLTSIVTISSAA